MQELGKQNPELLQMINSNQEEFLRMINEPAPQGQPGMAELAAQLGAAGGGAGTLHSALSKIMQITKILCLCCWKLRS